MYLVVFLWLQEKAKIVVSSDCVFSGFGISLVYMIKRRGPGMKPSGAPHF